MTGTSVISPSVAQLVLQVCYCEAAAQVLSAVTNSWGGTLSTTAAAELVAAAAVLFNASSCIWWGGALRTAAVELLSTAAG